MNYKGIEIKEFTSENPVIFDQPKLMLVWNEGAREPSKDNVFAFIPKTHFHVIGSYYTFEHCAEIPEVHESKLVTYRELARWLAKGNGEVKNENTICPNWNYWDDQENCIVRKSLSVRKWDETEWHEPTREYIGLENKSMELNKFDYKEQGQDHIGE